MRPPECFKEKQSTGPNKGKNYSQKRARQGWKPASWEMYLHDIWRINILGKWRGLQKKWTKQSNHVIYRIFPCEERVLEETLKQGLEECPHCVSRGLELCRCPVLESGHRWILGPAAQSAYGKWWTLSSVRTLYQKVRWRMGNNTWHQSPASTHACVGLYIHTGAHE